MCILSLQVRTGALDVVVLDSVAALSPKAELVCANVYAGPLCIQLCLFCSHIFVLLPLGCQEGDMGDVHMGLLARLMGQALRKIIGSVAKSK